MAHAVAGGVADQIMVMDHGRIIETGPPERIFGQAENPRTREFLQAVITRA